MMRKRRLCSPLPTPDPKPDARTLGDLGYLLRQAAGAHRLRMDRALADLALTPPQFLVLTLLAAHPGQSSADLARMAMLTTATISVIVANLDRMGALVRRPHAVHGRIQHLDLSPAGERLLAAGRLRAGAVEAELIAAMTDAEADTIRGWLLRAASLGHFDTVGVGAPDPFAGLPA